jgi:hypothetical protein
LSACSLSGLLLGLPRLPATGGTASSRSSKGMLSWTLAPVSRKASGMPWRSVIRWRLVLGLPRSAGFGPVAAPLFWPRWTNCPCRRGSNRCGLRPAVGLVARGEDGPIPRPLASRAAAASKSHPTRTPSPPAASPMECQCAARTGCRSTQHATEQVAGHLWVWAKPVEAAAR